MSRPMNVRDRRPGDPGGGWAAAGCPASDSPAATAAGSAGWIVGAGELSGMGSVRSGPARRLRTCRAFYFTARVSETAPGSPGPRAGCRSGLPPAVVAVAGIPVAGVAVPVVRADGDRDPRPVDRVRRVDGIHRGDVHRPVDRRWVVPVGVVVVIVAAAVAAVVAGLGGGRAGRQGEGGEGPQGEQRALHHGVTPEVGGTGGRGVRETPPRNRTPPPPGLAPHHPSRKRERRPGCRAV